MTAATMQMHETDEAALIVPSDVRPADKRAARFIDVRGLRKTFSGDGAPVHALRGLDLVVPEGSFLGMMGQSGSGKSTFLAMLGGLSHPTAGSISVDGIDLYELPASGSRTSAASTWASSSSPSTSCPT